MPLQSEGQEKKQIIGVVGVRMTAAHGTTARHGATILTKTVTDTMDGKILTKTVTISTEKTTAMHPQIKIQEAHQALTVTGAKMVMGNGVTATTGPGPTPGCMQNSTMTMAVRPGVKMDVCTGTRRRKSAGRLN